MALMEISVVPLGTSSPSVSSYVKDVLKVLKDKPDIEYELTSMGTIINSDSVKRLMQIAAEMHDCAMNNAERVNTYIKIDDRKDKKLSMQGKIDSVHAKEENDRKINLWIRDQAGLFLKKLGIKQGDVIIDFGCRAGNYTFPAAQAVTETGRVYAIDKETRWLNKIEKKNTEYGFSNITVVGSAFWRSAIDNSSVDAVLLFDVLHPGYFPEKEQRLGLIKDLRGAVKKSGYLCILATHLGMYDMSEDEFIQEVNECGFILEKKIKGELIHDGKLEDNDILIFKHNKEEQ